MTAPVPYAGFNGCEWPIDDSCLGEEWEAMDEDIQQRSLALASNTLRRLTGYRVGGCPITVRPCKQDCGSGARWGYPYSGYGWFNPYIDNSGVWHNDCGCRHDCSCTVLCTVNLPGPVGVIYEVKVDGAVVDEADYRMDGNSLIWMGTDACPWPVCQNLALPDTEVGTFSVNYLNSFPVDGLGAYAAGILAKEYGLACNNQGCRFPATVTAITRMGTTFEIPAGAFPNGFTGIREVDAYIALWNPKALMQDSSVWTPDMPKVHR